MHRPMLTAMITGAGDRSADAGAPLAVVPFELDNALVFMRGHLNGRVVTGAPAEWFLLDSGLEFTALNAERASSLGLRVAHERSEQVPGGAIKLGHVDDVAVLLPGPPSEVELLPSGRLRTLPLGAVEEVIGRRLGGILGHDVFTRYVIEIDYAARQVRLYEPSRFVTPTDAARLALTIEDDQPFVTAELVHPGRAPVPAKLKVDVGSASGLGLNGAFVRDVDLVAPGQRVLPAPGVALGGQTENYVTRLEGLRLGPFLLSRPVVGYAADTTRVGDAGTLGGDVLRRFTVVFDYSRGHLLLTPNASLREPDEYDMSGMFLTAQGEAFDTVVVRSVLPDSPAADAGVLPGDVIIRVETTSGPLTLASLRQLLREPGRTVRLGIARAAATQTVVLRLRRLI